MEVGLIVLWVALGLVSLILVTQGGLRHARESFYADSRAGRIGLQVAMVVTFAFGLSIPAVVMISNGEDKASVIAGSNVRLGTQAQKGRVLFSETCSFCHTLKAANAVGRTGPDLDVLVPNTGETTAERKAFVLSSMQSGFAGRYGQMPKEIYSGREAEEVAEFVAKSAGR